MTRYDRLYAVLDAAVPRVRAAGPRHGCFSMIEVGTYDGARAISLAQHWRRVSGNAGFLYVGFDVFEAMTPSLNAKELSKARLPPSRAEVLARLHAAGMNAEVHGAQGDYQHGPDAPMFKLVAGNTHVTLPAFVRGRPATAAPPDLIYQDGGHSLGTVANDWEWCRRLMGPDTVYLFDDYYPHRTDVGAKPLVDGLAADPRYAVRVLDPADHYPHNGLTVRFAEVRLA